MAAWRNCKASETLIKEINAKFPNRDKASDGTLGDAAHASRKSDHNPWVKDRHGFGVVRARDIDEDLDGRTADTGADARSLFNHLLGLAKAGDPRLNNGGYIIYEKQIYSGERGNWAPRPYSGPNAHRHHIHVSFSLRPEGYDSTAPWGIANVGQPPKPPTPPPVKKGFLDMLSDAEQKELLQKTRENNLLLIAVNKKIEGDDPSKGNMFIRLIKSATRVEQKLGTTV